MMKSSETIYSALKLVAMLATAAVVTGCVSAKTAPSILGQPSTSGSGSGSVFSWTVTEGEHLWGIAGSDGVYSMSERWPLIYKSNLDQIDDADLIFPGQVLKIPQDSSQSEIDSAVNHAKSRGAWTIGPVEISDKEYLNAP